MWHTFKRLFNRKKLVIIKNFEIQLLIISILDVNPVKVLQRYLKRTKLSLEFAPQRVGLLAALSPVYNAR